MEFGVCNDSFVITALTAPTRGKELARTIELSRPAWRITPFQWWRQQKGKRMKRGGKLFFFFFFFFFLKKREFNQHTEKSRPMSPLHRTGGRWISQKMKTNPHPKVPYAKAATAERDDPSVRRRAAPNSKHDSNEIDQRIHNEPLGKERNPLAANQLNRVDILAWLNRRNPWITINNRFSLFLLLERDRRPKRRPIQLLLLLLH